MFPSKLSVIRFALILLVLVSGVTIQAQNQAQADAGTLDTTHYIPPFWAVGGVNTHYLALSTPEPAPFEVTLETKAGLVETVTLSRDEPVIVNLSAAPFGTTGFGSLGMIDQTELNQINTSDGLILSAERRFYANIRHLVGSHGASLTAKGRSALGTRFRSGHMKSGFNGGNFNHFIAVMASEDGTTVNFGDIEPSLVFRDGAGTFDGVPQPGVLDRGESFVIGVRLSDVDAGARNALNGTLITSDKPIVVNSGSWLGGRITTGFDIGIDQILPTQLTGTEFILAQGLATSNADILEVPIVVADTDNTQIFVNGETLPLATIDAGDHFLVSGANYSASGTLYLRTSQPASVFQTTAGGDSSRNLGMNYVVALSDAIKPQEVILPSVDQLGTAYLDVISPAPMHRRSKVSPVSRSIVFPD